MNDPVAVLIIIIAVALFALYFTGSLSFHSYSNNSKIPFSCAAPNFSNIILSASLKSAFNPAPSSASALSILTKGSYTLSEALLSQLISSSVSSSQSVSTVPTPKALLSYVDSYIPGMVFAGNLSYNSSAGTLFYFYLNNPDYGISETFSYAPSFINSSSLYSSFSYLPNNYNLTIGGQPAIGSNSTVGSDYSYIFYTIYNGEEYTISAAAPLNTSYLTELNNTILKTVKNLPLQDVS